MKTTALSWVSRTCIQEGECVAWSRARCACVFVCAFGVLDLSGKVIRDSLTVSSFEVQMLQGDITFAVQSAVRHFRFLTGLLGVCVEEVLREALL